MQFLLLARRRGAGRNTEPQAYLESALGDFFETGFADYLAIVLSKLREIMQCPCITYTHADIRYAHITAANISVTYLH